MGPQQPDQPTSGPHQGPELPQTIWQDLDMTALIADLKNRNPIYLNKFKVDPTRQPARFDQPPASPPSAMAMEDDTPANSPAPKPTQAPSAKPAQPAPTKASAPTSKPQPQPEQSLQTSAVTNAADNLRLIQTVLASINIVEMEVFARTFRKDPASAISQHLGLLISINNLNKTING
nr:cell division protein ZipA-like [Maniola hyperantus]